MLLQLVSSASCRSFLLSGKRNRRTTKTTFTVATHLDLLGFHDCLSKVVIGYAGL